jgi:hypothetical protein
MAARVFSMSDFISMPSSIAVPFEITSPDLNIL